MKFKIMLSGPSSGITLRNLPREQATEIFNSVVGAEGLTRLCVVPEAPEQPVITQTKPVIKTRPEKKVHKDPTKFYETKAIPNKELPKEIELPMLNMSYHDLGIMIVICYGENKVYTTWADIERLPCPVPSGSIMHLNNSKQTAVRTFRRWIADGKPDIDPDADYRKILNTDTRTNGKIEYDADAHL